MGFTSSRLIHVRLLRTKARAVFLLSCVAIFFSASLRAQQSEDLPDMPTVRPATDATADIGESSSISRSSPDFRERFRIYKRSFTKPESFIGPLLGAGVGQARNTPPEWGQGAQGFAERAASGYARSVISRTIALGVATLDGEDSRYVPSHQSGVWRRGWYATTRTFLSSAPGGGNMPAFSRFAGVYGAAFIANSWEPSSQRDSRHALQRGSTALLSSVGWRIFEEFWPDVRRKVLHRPE